MTENRKHSTKDTPTAESVQEALKLLRNLTEKKTPGNGEPVKKTAEDDNGLPDAETLKKIEDVLKGVSSFLNDGTKEKTASAAPDHNEDENEEEDTDEEDTEEEDTEEDEEEDTEEEDDEDEEEEDDDDDDDNDEDNPFADDYFWNPGPEWKTIGLVAGGAALVGLGILIAKMLDD